MTMLNANDELDLLERDARDMADVPDDDTREISQHEARRAYYAAIDEMYAEQAPRRVVVEECHEIGGPETW